MKIAMNEKQKLLQAHYELKLKFNRKRDMPRIKKLLAFCNDKNIAMQSQKNKETGKLMFVIRVRRMKEKRCYDRAKEFEAKVKELFGRVAYEKAKVIGKQDEKEERGATA